MLLLIRILFERMIHIQMFFDMEITGVIERARI